jgi:YfiH family protein
VLADRVGPAVALGPARVRFTTRTDGDLNADRSPPAELAGRWAAVAGHPVTWLDEVHGTDVVVVTRSGEHAGAVADAAVTAVPGVALGIWVGDCAPVALASQRGIIGAAHAGWRGLAAGVLSTTVAAMRAAGAVDIEALVGPCIHPECYEFGDAELDVLTALLGPAVRASTAWGTPAFDLPAAVTAALEALDVRADRIDACTACDADRFFSHRARGDEGRHGMVVWTEP